VTFALRPISVKEATRCGWCRSELPATRLRFCSTRCRQSAWRLRSRVSFLEERRAPLRMAYADPPYPGLSWKYYRDAEVDHAALIASLLPYEGWALSTSSKSLRDVLPLCPAGARVCAWVKPIGVPPATYGLHSVWEPLIVVGGRQLPPGRPDWLRAMPARNEGTLPGRKPLAFCAWLFACLGLAPGDTFDDLFPGTGIVSRAWAEVCRSAPAVT
jgi:hypothetical protein